MIGQKARVAPGIAPPWLSQIRTCTFVNTACGLPSRAIPSLSPRPVTALDPIDWPSLWARCWSRIRTWQSPPHWSPRQWWDEAHAQGALAACEAIRAFEASRLVPLDAFLYCRVVESVWTRYRQECHFGRRCRPDIRLPELAAPGAERPDGALLERLEAILRTLDEGELRLIRQLFWDGRFDDELARELGLTRQAVNKRKQKLLRRLGSDLMLEGVA
jgi:DNA-directed RNA polymerase specialized sigma24 family protein